MKEDPKISWSVKIYTFESRMYKQPLQIINKMIKPSKPQIALHKISYINGQYEPEKILCSRSLTFK